MRFFICDPLAKQKALQIMEHPRVLHIFLQSWYQDNQGTMRGQTLKGEKL